MLIGSIIIWLHSVMNYLSCYLIILLYMVMNRPAPPLPDFYLSEETVSEAAAFIRKHINALLSVSQDIALGKDTQMFMRVFTYLLLISVIGCFMDFLTLGYLSKFFIDFWNYVAYILARILKFSLIWLP